MGAVGIPSYVCISIINKIENFKQNLLVIRIE